MQLSALAHKLLNEESPNRLDESVFHQTFDEIPDSPPYGFWVDYNGGWMAVKHEAHQRIAEEELGLSREDPDEVYAQAFTKLRWARLNCWAKLSVNGHRLSNAQRRTIKDIADLYRIPVSYENYVSAGEIDVFRP